MSEPTSPKSSRRRRARRQHSGCLFLLATCLFTCLLLLLNAALATSLYSMLNPYLPRFLRSPRFAQLMLFVVPVILIFAQWRLVDMVAMRAARKRRS